MRAYQAERIENAMAFFIREHRRKTHQSLYQTSLWKYLAFFEYRTLCRTGNMPLGLKYGALERGPVPMDIYSKVTSGELKSNYFRLIQEEGHRIRFESTASPDLDYFSENEIKEMNDLIDIFAQRWITSRVMSDASHQEIIPWRITRKRNPDSIIDWSLEFPGVHGKKIEDLTDQEERFLMNESFARLGTA